MFPIRDNVPTRTLPYVTYGLMAINVAVWVFYELPNLDYAVNSLAFQPCEVNDSCPVVGYDWPVNAITAMFMHGDWLHIGGNMLFLWIFGNNVEDALGHFRYAVFYLLGGLAATALQTFVTLYYGAPEAALVPNLGASGAISAVLGAYIVLLPGAGVLTLIFFGIILIRELPAWLFLGVWFLLQAWMGGFSVLHPQQGGGVAFFAHIGGFVFGVLAVRLFQKRSPLQPAY
jgi:membrane associated rhomboid family serine protease